MLTYHQRRPISREVIHNISLENKLLKLLPHFLGTNELIHHNHYFLSPVQLPSYLARSRTWGFHKYHHHNTPPRRPPSHPYSAEGRVTLTSHRCRRPAEQQHEFWPQKAHHFWRRECVLDAWKKEIHFKWYYSSSSSSILLTHNESGKTHESCQWHENVFVFSDS